MPYEYDENEELVWIDPPPTEQELRIQEFAKQIQSVAAGDVLSLAAPPPNDGLVSQMQMLDLMFRSLVTDGAPQNHLAFYKAAIRTQSAYRRTWETLNDKRARRGLASRNLLPPIDTQS